MAEASAKRRGHGEDAIYFAAAKNRYVGAVSLGYTPEGKRIRRKVYGRTKQDVRDKLKALHQELEAGIRSPVGYTVRDSVQDWLREGLDGRSERTRVLYEGLLEPVLEIIGTRPLRDLRARDVRSALSQFTARYSTRSLQITRNSLDRAIQHAQANDLVARNVAALVESPRGRAGRPSRSFTLEQAKALLAVTEGMSVVKLFGPTDRHGFRPRLGGLEVSWAFCCGWWSCWCGAGRTGCRSRGCGR